MSKRQMRKDRALEEVARQKGKRRAGIVQTCIGGILAVVGIFGVQVLQGAGILPYGNMVVSFVTFATVVAACAVLGMGVRTFTRASQQINALRQRYGISDEEVRGL